MVTNTLEHLINKEKIDNIVNEIYEILKDLNPYEAYAALKQIEAYAELANDLIHLRDFNQ